MSQQSGGWEVIAPVELSLLVPGHIHEEGTSPLQIMSSASGIHAILCIPIPREIASVNSRMEAIPLRRSSAGAYLWWLKKVVGIGEVECSQEFGCYQHGMCSFRVGHLDFEILRAFQKRRQVVKLNTIFPR